MLITVTGQQEKSESPPPISAKMPQYLCSLCDELGGIKLCYHRLEDLVDNRREDSLIVVLPQPLVHGWQVGCHGSGQHPHSYIHHLQIYIQTCAHPKWLNGFFATSNKSPTSFVIFDFVTLNLKHIFCLSYYTGTSIHSSAAVSSTS